MSTVRPQPRSRVSRQRYMVRRITAIGLLALAAFGGVKAGTALFDGDDGSIAEASDPATTDPAVVTASTSVLAGSAGAAPQVAATDAPESTSTTEAVPEHTGPPTREHPATVLIVGDSDAGTFGPYLEQLLDATKLTETVLDYKVSSGLARPDYFDWPAELRRSVPAAVPDIVVVTFGGNDAQGLADVSGSFVAGQPTPESSDDNAAWRAEYGRRVGEVMDYLLQDGRTVIWVGIPNDDSPDVTARMRVQDETVKAEAAKRPALHFVDTWRRFSGRNGGWAEFVVDPRDGVGKDVRASDGFHLNENGAEILALDIVDVIRADLAARGAQL